MKIIDIVKSLLPEGTDGTSFSRLKPEKVPSRNNVHRCPIWPPDVFAVTGTLIERSGCYTLAGPDANALQTHKAYLAEISSVVDQWAGRNFGLFATPKRVNDLWAIIVDSHAQTQITDICAYKELVDALLRLFAFSDEACKGMGWDNSIGTSIFSDLALLSFITDIKIPKTIPILPYAPNSLCALVPPTAAIVMPKTLTATVGCTIRSLSHHLALLPGLPLCCPEWAITNEYEPLDAYKPIRLMVIPFPFSIPSESFVTSLEPQHLMNGNSTAAFFGLKQHWLRTREGKNVTAKMLFNELVRPLLEKDANKDVAPLTGIIMPECALSEKVADQLAALLSKTSVSFFTTGILKMDSSTGKTRNVAKTYVLHRRKRPIVLEQYKHHRWRLDRAQCEQYGLDFQRTSRADKWWEQIDVSERKLPFFALRKDMSMTVLICEDLARNDPAMSVVRAVGPNLVIALLMDGPQLNARWPGRYATVLGEDPGSGVLSVTCVAMVDRSNNSWSGEPKRMIGLWRSEDGSGKEIELVENDHAVVLNIHSDLVRQHTLDNRSDDFSSRKLSLGQVSSIKLDNPPKWL